MQDKTIKYHNFLNIILILKDKYGSILFTEDRFWGILTDFYNFNGESILKDTAKECVKNGYAKEIDACNDHLIEIKRILRSYESESDTKQEAVATVLFSIAIAINKASLEDYESCLEEIKEKYEEGECETNEPQETRGSDPSNADPYSSPNPLPPGSPSDKLPFKYILYLLLGLLILLGSIYFYSAYLYHNFPIGFIILLEAIAQLFYIFCSMRIVENQSNLSVFQRIKYASLLFPILLCLLFTDLTPWILMEDSFKEALYIAFSGDIGYYNILSETNPGGIQVAFPKSPGIFTFLGTALFLFTEYSCISGLVRLKRKYAGKISHSYTSLSWLSFAVILITLGTCLGMHIHKCGKNRKEYLTENQIILKNIEKRAQEVKSLSFQGIELGAPIDIYEITTSDGKVHEVSKANIDKYGMDAYASAYKGATLRMRDKEGADYDIPLVHYDKAVAKGLHVFTLDHNFSGIDLIEQDDNTPEKETISEDIKWLYRKLKAKGYNIGDEKEFTASLANEADRDWYYDKAVGMGLDVGSREYFHSLFAYSPVAYSRVLITLESSEDIVTDIFNNKPLEFLKRKEEILKEKGHSEPQRGISVTETSYRAKSNFFNNEINIEVVENQGKVGSILIKPDNELELCAKFKNFNDIYQLYVKKYGEPARAWRSQKYFWYDNEDSLGRLYYSWKFKNCEIQLSKYNIIYIDLEFVERLSSLIDDHNSMVNEKIRAQNDSIAREKHRADSIKQAQIREDSLRKLRHERNAINEI